MTKFLRTLTLDKIAMILLSLATIAVLWIGIVLAYPRVGDQDIAIATGTTKGETYILMQAVKTVAERYYPRLKIKLLETSGTVDSFNRLENGEAQMATGETGVMAGASARTVALLFPDTIQMLVHNDAKIQRFEDLKGKRIALTRTQGPFRTFMLLARHFGLREADFNFVGSDDDSAEVAFTRHEADAFFAVRVLHGGATMRLVRAGDVSIMPIDDALALHLEVPALQEATIPKDSYTADPPVPPADTPTVSADRVLLARGDVPDDVVYELTEILMERRQEIASAIPDTDEVARVLPANIRPPDGKNGLTAGVHHGAAVYYNHGKTTISETEVFTGAVTVSVLVGMWMWAIRSSIRRRQKEYSDRFNRRVLQLMEMSQTSNSERQMATIRTELLALIEKAVLDLESNQLSEESFQTSRIVWQITFDLLRERVAASGGADLVALSRDPDPGQPRRWSLLRDL
jgi:TRAP transporter TAXI family solute receptor